MTLFLFGICIGCNEDTEVIGGFEQLVTNGEDRGNCLIVEPVNGINTAREGGGWE
jgi:hypothetical protein